MRYFGETDLSQGRESILGHPHDRYRRLKLKGHLPWAAYGRAARSGSPGAGVWAFWLEPAPRLRVRSAFLPRRASGASADARGVRRGAGAHGAARVRRPAGLPPVELSTRRQAFAGAVVPPGGIEPMSLRIRTGGASKRCSRPTGPDGGHPRSPGTWRLEAALLPFVPGDGCRGGGGHSADQIGSWCSLLPRTEPRGLITDLLSAVAPIADEVYNVITDVMN